MILQESILHQIGDTIGVSLSIPMLLGVIQAVRFLSKIEASTKESAAGLRHLTKTVEDHEERVRDNEGKIDILWDAHQAKRPYFPREPE